MTLLEQIKTEISRNRNKSGRANSDDGFDYLRNLLLAATGSFSGGYHLEFAVPNGTVARNLCDALAAYDIFAHIYGNDASAEKQSSSRVVIKDSESICNLLALVGANQSLYMLNDQIILRQARNNSNRRANCDTANIERQIEAAAVQVKSFSELRESPLFRNLSPELQNMVTARIEMPTATYDELAAELGITKSGVVHRIRKLAAINESVVN